MKKILPPKILHLITGLDTGGAETVLFNLLSALGQQEFDHQVISMTTLGPMAKKIQQLGIPVSCLDMKRKGWLAGFLSLVNILHKNPPDLLQTWMYHADLTGSLATLVSMRNLPVVWNIHNLDLHPARTKKTTLLVVQLCAWLSHILPRRVIFASQSGKLVHLNHGYHAGKSVVIPNGFDTTRFTPQPNAHALLCQALALPALTPLVGLAARFDPVKDHHTFIRAAGVLLKQLPAAHFVLCGDGITIDNITLAGWISDTGHPDHFHLLDRRDDMPHIMAGVDVLVLSSLGESFPVVLGEAMSCGTTCVSTDVGDAALIIGDTGLLVPPSNSILLADAIQQMLSLPDSKRRQLGIAARERIINQFSMHSMVNRYRQVWHFLLYANQSG